MKFVFQRSRQAAIALVFCVLTFLYGCGDTQGGDLISQSPTRPTAQAILTSTEDPSKILGEVNLVQTPEGLQITAQVQQSPSGRHGFHIHENGSCEENGNAAGGHFNPNGVKHGFIVKDGFEAAHAGDLGNIEIAEDGRGSLSYTVSGLTLSETQTEGEYAIGDRAFILHADPDDFGQPTGNAGGRIGCGTIQISQS